MPHQLVIVLCAVVSALIAGPTATVVLWTCFPDLPAGLVGIGLVAASVVCLVPCLLATLLLWWSSNRFTERLLPVSLAAFTAAAFLPALLLALLTGSPCALLCLGSGPITGLVVYGLLNTIVKSEASDAEIHPWYLKR